MHLFTFFIDPPPFARRSDGYVWAIDHEDALRRVAHPDAAVVQLHAEITPGEGLINPADGHRPA